MTVRINDLVDRLKAEARATGMPPSTLARACNLNLNTLRKMHKPGWNPNLRTLLLVDRYLSNRAAGSP